jgi:hypothetical protein
MSWLGLNKARNVPQKLKPTDSSASWPAENIHIWGRLEVLNRFSFAAIKTIAPALTSVKSGIPQAPKPKARTFDFPLNKKPGFFGRIRVD